MFRISQVKASDITFRIIGYHISDIVSDTRKAFRICYDTSPYLNRRSLPSEELIASVYGHRQLIMSKQKEDELQRHKTCIRVSQKVYAFYYEVRQNELKLGTKVEVHVYKCFLLGTKTLKI